ncbi:mannose-ethanolamine phosphotransferase gpi13 [Malassezia sp. CBS 17886]|nr:mannose-ethanolamine phosphotransferase gpi13 [Malassezia sp. CBS 17886]
MTTATGARGVQRPFCTLLALVALVGVLHVAGLLLFTSGFLLQRVELAQTAACGVPPADDWAAPLPPPNAAAGDRDALRAWDAALDPVHGRGECVLPPRFRRVVVWIVDALRYDFIAPVPPATPAWAPNAHMHGILRTPAAVAAARPQSAFLAHFAADAPTTTLQRLKGLTTGSLPTFIEAGANFGGAGRVQEDTWIAQLRSRALRERGTNATQAGLAFVGDDTWEMVFSALFDDGYTWPYSSFNVEDLDTVDAGVTQHLLGMLDGVPVDAPPANWTLLVAHSLGVDHVGHRFGPAHPRMAPKLAQMDLLVQDVMNRLDDDTLFVLLGDHGMDATGDHGGDSELEVGSALWVYARAGLGGGARRALQDDPDVAALLRASPPHAATHAPFAPLGASLHRTVPQIDLVPTLSVLLGLPVPFSNLGTVIPELAADARRPLSRPGGRLLRALRMNARQVRTYLAAHAEQSADLAASLASLEERWAACLVADARFALEEHRVRGRMPFSGSSAALEDAARAATAAYAAYTRAALAAARAVWAQFDALKMALGAAVLSGSVLVAVWLWSLAAPAQADASVGGIGARVVRALRRALPVAAAGTATAASVPLAFFSRVEAALAAASVVALGALAWEAVVGRAGAREGAAVRAQSSGTAAAGAAPAGAAPAGAARPQGGAWRAAAAPLGAVLVLAHAGIFASNSFTMWEDRIVLGLFAAGMLVRGVQGLGAPIARLQQRLPLLALGALLLVRLAAMSRVCREEQAPYCTPTFYAMRADTRFADNPAYALSGAATNSPWAIAAAYVAAYFVPAALLRMLQPSRADAGVATALLSYVLRPALLGAAAFWLADWAHGLDRWDAHMSAWLLQAKTWVARVDLALVGAGAVFWVLSPLCLSTRRADAGGAPTAAGGRIAVLGFANSFGSAFLLLAALAFALLFLLAQPMGQLALGACFLAAVLLADLGDGEGDARAVRAAARSAGDADAVAAAAAAAVPTFLEVVCFALLGYVAFFATGHQATFAAIQWRVAFVGCTRVVYPWSPMFVALNAFGPVALLPAMAVVLRTLWNVAPMRMRADAASPPPQPLALALLRVSMGFIFYHAVLALSAAAWAAYFRRHLMLFKIWVPRFMTGALSLLFVDVALLLALAGAWSVAAKVHALFGTRVR